jgi:hypothetical protein
MNIEALVRELELSIDKEVKRQLLSTAIRKVSRTDGNCPLKTVRPKKEAGIMECWLPESLKPPM